MQDITVENYKTELKGKIEKLRLSNPKTAELIEGEMKQIIYYRMYDKLYGDNNLGLLKKLIDEIDVRYFLSSFFAAFREKSTIKYTAFMAELETIVPLIQTNNLNDLENKLYSIQNSLIKQKKYLKQDHIEEITAKIQEMQYLIVKEAIKKNNSNINIKVKVQECMPFLYREIGKILQISDSRITSLQSELNSSVQIYEESDLTILIKKILVIEEILNEVKIDIKLETVEDLKKELDIIGDTIYSDKITILVKKFKLIYSKYNEFRDSDELNNVSDVHDIQKDLYEIWYRLLRQDIVNDSNLFTIGKMTDYDLIQIITPLREDLSETKSINDRRVKNRMEDIEKLQVYFRDSAPYDIHKDRIYDFKSNFIDAARLLNKIKLELDESSFNEPVKSLSR